MKKRFRLFHYFLLIPLLLSGCASAKHLLGINDHERAHPIANPFYSYRGSASDPAQNMILRTKKGDRSVELEIPGNSAHLSDFVLPVSPAFRDTDRSPASNSIGDDAIQIDESYKSRPPTLSDREITHSFSQGSPEIDAKRQNIEKSLNLAPNEDNNVSERSTSYLASVDHIKQLYKTARYEAALLETDEMIREYQTDAKLYEMRGTLLDRMGKRELALKAWNQALRFDSKNESLKKFIDRLQQRSTAGTP